MKKEQEFKLKLDASDFDNKIAKANVKLQQEKDKIKDITKAIKELKRESGARKDLVIEKAKAEQNVKALKKEVKDYQKEVDKTAQKSKIAWGSIAAGIGLVIAASIKLIGLSNKQEDAEKGLDFMLGKRSQKYKDIAKQMQKQYNVGDEIIMQNMRLALSMGVSEKNLIRVTEGALGLSKALGGRVGVNMATRMLTNAIEEQDFTLLNTYIPAMKTAGTTAEKNAILNDLLTKSMGFASDQTKTFAGETEALKLALSDMGETIGDEIKQSIGSPGGVGLIGGFSRFFNMAIEGFRIIGTNIGKWLEGVISIEEKFFTSIFHTMNAVISTFNNGFQTVYNIGYDTFENLGKQIFDLLHGGDSSKSYVDIWTNNFKKGFNTIKSDWNIATNSIKKNVKELDFEFLKFDATLGATKEKVEAVGDGAIESGKKTVKMTKEQIAKEKEYQTELKKTADMIAKWAADPAAGIGGNFPELPSWMNPEKTEEIKQSWQDTTDFILDQGMQLGNIFTEMNNREIQEVDNKYNAEKQKYADMLERNLISKEDYDKEIEKLDNKAAKEKTKLLKKQQKIDIAMATMSTAQAVLSAFTAKDNLFSWQMWTQAALAGALGAAQIATIASQEFAKGGLPENALGGLSSNPNENVALVDRNTGKPFATMSSKEPIMGMGIANNPIGMSEASDLNEKYGGRAFAPSSNTVTNNNTTTREKVVVGGELRMDGNDLVAQINQMQGDQIRAGEDIWQ